MTGLWEFASIAISSIGFGGLIRLFDRWVVMRVVNTDAQQLAVNRLQRFLDNVTADANVCHAALEKCREHYRDLERKHLTAVSTFRVVLGSVRVISRLEASPAAKEIALLVETAERQINDAEGDDTSSPV